MTDHETPGENVSFLGGADRDVLVLEERLEVLLAAPIDPDATWALVRGRIGPEPSVVPLRTRRRPLRPLVLAIAAALLVSGVALAAVAQRGGSSERHIGPSGSPRGAIPAAAVRPGAGRDDPSLEPAPGADVSAQPPAPAGTPSADATTNSPSGGTSSGSTQEPGQDQQGSQDQGQESPDPSSTQDQQQDRSDTSDGSDDRSDASVASSGTDQGDLLPSSGEGDR
jgi:hypothetical protein